MAGDAWEELLKRLADMHALEPSVPSTLQAQLRDYQLEGYRWLARLAHWGAGACLADDMGLGKTVQAQAFKNALTKRSQAVMRLRGGFRIITTGTPIENHLGELWNLFRFINPGLLGSQESFNRRFAIPIEQHKDQAARQRLRQLLRPFILRRVKSEVLSELPPRTEITLRLEC